MWGWNMETIKALTIMGARVGFAIAFISAIFYTMVFATGTFTMLLMVGSDMFISAQAAALVALSFPGALISTMLAEVFHQYGSVCID